MDARDKICNIILEKPELNGDRDYLMEHLNIRETWKNAESGKTQFKLVNAIELALEGYDVAEYYFVYL